LSKSLAKYRASKWKKFREKILKRDGHRCLKCGDDEYLCVHHLNYDDYFDPKNVITLCIRCHAVVHGITPSDKKRYPSFFIREYLLINDEATPYEIYKALKEERKKHNEKFPQPPMIYNYFRILKKLGLIEVSRVETTFIGSKSRTKLPSNFNKKYYRLVKYDDRRWVDPQRALYPPKRGKKGAKKKLKPRESKENS